MSNDYINRTEGISFETRYTGDGAELQKAMDERDQVSPAQYRDFNTKTCVVCRQVKPIKGGKKPTNAFGVHYFICKDCIEDTDGKS